MNVESIFLYRNFFAKTFQLRRHDTKDRGTSGFPWTQCKLNGHRRSQPHAQHQQHSTSDIEFPSVRLFVTLFTPTRLTAAWRPSEVQLLTTSDRMVVIVNLWVWLTDIRFSHISLLRHCARYKSTYSKRRQNFRMGGVKIEAPRGWGVGAPLPTEEGVWGGGCPVTKMHPYP